MTRNLVLASLVLIITACPPPEEVNEPDKPKPSLDCNGVENGDAFIDDCDECVGGDTGEEACVPQTHAQDAGQPGPNPPATTDAGNTTTSPETADAGNTTTPPETADAGNTTTPPETADAGSAANPPETSDAGGGPVSLTDCNDVVGGEAYLDNCDRCVGGTTNRPPCEQDCHGDWGGTAFLDPCNLCVGGTTGRTPCDPDASDAGSNLPQAYVGLGNVSLTSVEITLKTEQDIQGLQFYVTNVSLAGTATSTDLVPSNWALNVAENGTFLAFDLANATYISAADVNCSPNAEPACDPALILTLPVSTYTDNQVCISGPILSTGDGDAIGPVELGECKPVP